MPLFIVFERCPHATLRVFRLAHMQCHLCFGPGWVSASGNIWESGGPKMTQYDVGFVSQVNAKYARRSRPCFLLAVHGCLTPTLINARDISWEFGSEGMRKIGLRTCPGNSRRCCCVFRVDFSWRVVDRGVLLCGVGPEEADDRLIGNVVP